MSYRWVPGAGSYSTDALEAAGLVKEFGSQEQAEEWLASFFEDLLDEGVADVSLYEESRHVYGPMPLTP